jgi:phosphatidylserine/phosphatidylglycerophosphate/cardiolipin synthase-like enzyme
VRALVACSNRGGEKKLRDLETKLLGAGIIVARTGDDLVRYHCKYLIIDSRELFVLGFNFTYLDTEQSRSFGVITDDVKIVAEAVKLFETDVARKKYAAQMDSFVVSPENARKTLSPFVTGAAKRLHIYDPNISDPAMIRALIQRQKDGVEIKVLGKISQSATDINVLRMRELRLHTRMILRDGDQIFIGSQSLRAMELDRRREVGLIFEDTAIARNLEEIFQADWAAAEQAKVEKEQAETSPNAQVAKKVAKAVVKELPPVAEVVEAVIQELGGDKVEIAIAPEELEENVKDAVKHAVKTAVKDAVLT